MNRIWMKKPASWAGELWRESLPIGNGLTSALLTGSVGQEHFLINRFDRWEDSPDPEIPDVSESLTKTRRLIRDGKYEEANRCLSEALSEKGYRVTLARPLAPVELQFRFEAEAEYRHYRRGIDMDTGEAFVCFDQGEFRFERRAFVSKCDDQAVLKLSGTGAMKLKIDKTEDERLRLSVCLPKGGELSDKGKYFEISDAFEVLVTAKFDAPPKEETYEVLLERHLPLYQSAWGDAMLDLGGGDNNTELLLDEAHEEEASAELYEKLWKFGRYLFVSGTAEGGNPFPLYGLWGGRANLPWTQNVANENVEMIYWHASVGGLSALVRPLIHYYYNKMDVFRDAAKKLFGCRGIYVSTYTSPVNSAPAPNVPVIVNYIGCAGWLSRHFYEYYRYTQDEALLNAEILPFMLEAARFYEDYAVWDENGMLKMIPSVSPENTPGNFMPEDFLEHMGHMNPVVWNSTMDFAILKELLTSLVQLSKTHAMDAARVQTWERMLSGIPDYMVNEKGAVREWMDERLSDFYTHRHLSHLYPLFPGEEVGKEHVLFSAFEKAVELRELGGLSGWAFSHMAAIYARLGRGSKALSCLNTLAKGCLLPNLFTLHNDWRDMGVSLKIDMFPVQLDALMGAVNALQEMLFGVRGSEISFLPACPDTFKEGSFRNFRFPGGNASLSWNRETGAFRAEITAEREIDVCVNLPAWMNAPRERLTLSVGETRRFERGEF